MKLYKSLSSALKEPHEVGALKLSLAGKFPADIFKLPYLRELYLEGICSDFHLPDNSFPELRILSLKCDSFQGELAEIFRLRHLENLKIIETPLKRLLLPIGAFHSSLKSLTIKSCELEGLPEEIESLQELSELYLSGNKLTALPHSFPGLSRLKRLNLDDNKFSQFPDLIQQMPQLKHLSIDGNDFSEDEKARIQRQFHITPH